MSAANPSVYVPIAMKRDISPGWDGLDKANTQWLNIFGRLQPGVSAGSGLAGVLRPLWTATLREQIADFRTQLAAMQSRLQAMEVTLQKAYDDKLSAEQGEAIAKNDLFNARLYIKKLIAQIKSLGAVPVDE